MTQRAKEVSGLEGRSGRDNCTAELLVWAGSTEGLHWGISCCFTLVFIFSQLVTHPHCGIGKVPVTQGKGQQLCRGCQRGCAGCILPSASKDEFPCLWAPRQGMAACFLRGTERRSRGLIGFAR